MTSRTFGMIAASAVTSILVSGAALAQAGGKTPAAAAQASGKCAHNCTGHAECKGNGNNSCKGKNSCANEGLVPKACSSKKTQADCTAVVDGKKEKMCTWFEG